MLNPALSLACRVKRRSTANYEPPPHSGLWPVNQIGLARTSDRESPRIASISALGQKRRFERWLITSGLPLTADIRRVRRHVANVPKAEVYPNSPYSLLRAIRPHGRSRHLAVLAQPVQGLMLTEAA
jgi:hypothetical protein